MTTGNRARLGFGLALGLTASLGVSACALDSEEAVREASDAIIDGELDGEDHPYVGLALFGHMDEAGGISLYWRCSGSLISPTTYLTAGHCTYDGGYVPNVALIWFDADANVVLDALQQGEIYPGVAVGTPMPHPEYADFAGFPNTHDVGAVDLWWPVAVERYAQVAQLGELDAYLEGPAAHKTLEAVGYGLQDVGTGVHPDVAEWVRMQASEKVLKNQNSSLTSGYNVQTVDTPRKMPKSVIEDPDYVAPASGGTCFGDSGGPQLLPGTDTIVAVTSFGLNSNCAGVGFHYRVDTQTSQDFINGL